MEEQKFLEAKQFFESASDVIGLQFAYSRYMCFFKENSNRDLAKSTKLLFSYITMNKDYELAFRLVTCKDRFCRFMEVLKYWQEEKQNEELSKLQIENAIEQIEGTISCLREIKSYLLVEVYRIDPFESDYWELSHDKTKFVNSKVEAVLEYPPTYEKIVFCGFEYSNPDAVMWIEDKIDDIPLTEEQYKIFLKGFYPDWEFRYAPFQYKGWSYIIRSGFWVKKFHYEKQQDGLYHIVEHYTSSRENDHNVMPGIYRHLF